MPSNFDLAADDEWGRAGDALDYSTELMVEWGVEFSGPTGTWVSVYGGGEDDETAARRYAATCRPGQGMTARVVARRVLTGPWGERDE